MDLSLKDLKELLREDVKTSGYVFYEFIGKKVTIFCCRYFYTGKLIEVGEYSIKLEDPSIIYETGAFTDSSWKDAQSLNVKTWNISKDAIESFGILK